ncbi:MAG: hypothetical protein ACXWPK_11775, partial [Isosphaeraceae bacterium]
LLEPDDPVIQPDPHAAWGLLSQARDLAKSPVLRARLLFAMGSRWAAPARWRGTSPGRSNTSRPTSRSIPAEQIGWPLDFTLASPSANSVSLFRPA